MFIYSKYWKNDDIEKHFKKYAEKLRLGNVSLLTSIKNIFKKALGRSSKCYKYKNCNGFSILVKNENGDVAIDT